MEETLNSQQSTHDRLLLSFKYILDFYHGDVELKTISTILSPAKRHVQVEDLQHGAVDFGLNFEEASMSSDIVYSHIFPCIVTGEDADEMILTGLDKGTVYLMDPLTHEKSSSTMVELVERFDTLLYFYKDITPHLS